MKAKHGKTAMVVGLVALATLAGCREHEQERPLSYAKGTYQGNPDTALSSDTLDALRQRARNQSYY
jgi:hypothetical protein